MHDQVVTIRDFFDKDKTEKTPIKKIIEKKCIAKKEKKLPLKKKWISAQDRKEIEKLKNFIAYAPKDAYTEAALAVETKSTNFDAQARQISVDINADDNKGMYREQRQKIW